MARMLHKGFTRKAFASKGDDTTLLRWVKIKGAKREHGKPKQGMLRGIGHPTVEAGRSIFYRKGMKSPGDNPLVSGHNNVKIGRDVRKGHLRGYWIYTLSLEERATCPRSCAHWYDCYGNNMPFAKRLEHGPELEAAIEAQLARLLAVRGRRGVLVRLHALGDFYSVEYVDFWRRMLAQFPTLALFGYSARHNDAIGTEIALMIRQFGWGRAAIRFSDAPWPTNATISAQKVEDAPANAFVCPEQTGRTQCCATCGACWGTTKNVAFLGH